MLKRRNPIARSPLLRKGGAHVKSKTGQRVRARLTTQNAIDEWQEELNDKREEQNIREQQLPDSFLVRIAPNLLRLPLLVLSFS